MIQRSRFFILVSLLLSLAARCHGQSGIDPANVERVGQAGWQFLKINGDVRTAGMASTLAATSHGDAAACFANPSTLVDVKGVQAVFSRMNWIADIGYQTLAVAGNLGAVGTFAISITAVDYGEMPETINQVTTAGDRSAPVITGNTFTASDIAVGVTYARKITDQLSVGGSIRYLREQIAELSMHGWSFDFGTTYYTGFESLRIGMIARNFGPDSRLVGWSEEYHAEAVIIHMPLDFRIGVAMDFLGASGDPHFLTVSVEGCHPNDGPERLHLGMEYSFEGIFFLRGGYRFNYDEESYTFGAGFDQAFGDFAVRLNYAYRNFGRLNYAHALSVGFSLEY